MKTQIELVPHVLVTLTEQEARQIVVAIRDYMNLPGVVVAPPLSDLYHDLNSRLQLLDEDE